MLGLLGTLWFPPAVSRQETIMRNLRIRVLWDTEDSQWQSGPHWILRNRRYMVGLTGVNYAKLHTPNYTGHAWNSSPTVNTSSYYCYPRHVYTSSCVWVWAHGDLIHLCVRRSPFGAIDRVCKWKHHTLPKCSTSKCWSVKNTVCVTVPRRRKALCRLSLTLCSSSPQVSLLLFSVTQLYLCLKMTIVPNKRTVGNACCYSSAAGGAEFKRSEPVGQ